MGNHEEKACRSTDRLYMPDTFGVISPAGVLCRASQHCITAMSLDQIRVLGALVRGLLQGTALTNGNEELLVHRWITLLLESVPIASCDRSKL